MEQVYTQNTVITETTVLSCLTISDGVTLMPPEGKLLTLTVDGIHRDLLPGTYRGSVVLSVTDPVCLDYENHGNIETFRMNAAVAVRDGKYVAGSSVEAAQISGKVGDGAADGLVLRSEGDYFGGVYVDGGHFELRNTDIVMNGHGGSDAVGYGASVAETW